MSKSLRFGVQTWNQDATFAEFVDTWKLIDRLRFDTAWVFDHFLPILTDPSRPCLEGWTLLSALARETDRVRLGVLVSGNTFRHPAILAKMASTVDHISNGRLILGIGAAWFEREHAAYGLPFYTVGERIRRLDEAVELIRCLWTEPAATFDGRYYTLSAAHCEPKPQQKPGLPILIGGGGEELMLKVVAKHADIWNTFGNPAIFQHKSGILHEHCVEVGRRFEDIEISWAGWGLVARSSDEKQSFVQRVSALTGRSCEEVDDWSLIGTADQIIARIEQFVNAGVRHFIISILAPFDHDQLRRFSDEVIGRFRG